MDRKETILNIWVSSGSVKNFNCGYFERLKNMLVSIKGGNLDPNLIIDS
jgi:hypothetical protein